jgi:hypothetical protein
MPDPNDQNAQDWKAALPQDLQTHEALKEFKGVEDVVKGYLDTSTKLAGFEVPPESADKYAFTKPTLPEGVPWTEANDAQLVAMRDIALRLKLGPKGAQELANVYGESIAAMHEEATRAAQEATDKLKAEWGKDHDANMALARETMEKLGGKELVEYIGSDPTMLRFFAKLGPKFKEDDSSGGAPRKTGETPGEGKDHAKILFGNS